MESLAGADAPGAETPPPAAALPPAAAPLGDRKRSRAACAAEQYQLNEKYRQHHMDDSEAAGDVMIVVKDGTHSFVLASGVFVDLRQDAGTVYGTLLHAVEKESAGSIDFMSGYMITWEDSRSDTRRLVSVADYATFSADVLARPVRARLAPSLAEPPARAPPPFARSGVSAGRIAARGP